jgi:DNA repair protein RadC
VADYLAPRYSGFGVERFGVLLLDQKQRVIRSEIVSTGTMEANITHPREVFRIAMLAAASHVVLFHNHPSGDPLPSPADRMMTRRMQIAGEMIGIDVMDHIILGSGTFFSFRQEGMV